MTLRDFLQNLNQEKKNPQLQLFSIPLVVITVLASTTDQSINLFLSSHCLASHISRRYSAKRQMDDLEETQGKEGSRDALPGILASLDGNEESKSTSSSFQAISWMIVNTLATVGIASGPPKDYMYAFPNDTIGLY
jgi:hypothetical protein